MYVKKTSGMDFAIQQHGHKVRAFSKSKYRDKYAAYYHILNALYYGKSNYREVARFRYDMAKIRIAELKAADMISEHDIGLRLRLKEKGYQYLYVYEEMMKIYPKEYQDA